MREIKFRGKRKKYNSLMHDSDWKYGNLLNKCSIGDVGIGLTEYNYAEVLPETVGQFTGLQDKNGNDIYEGDNIKTNSTRYVDVVFEVIFENGAFCFKHNGFLNGAFETNTILINRTIFECEGVGLEFECEVIGNIHDKSV